MPGREPSFAGSSSADATWRVTDTTAILADAQYNVDEGNLSTASIGLAASRDTHVSYFVGVRYIDTGEFAPLWAGEAASLGTEMPAGELTLKLAAEAQALMQRLAR